MIEKFHVPYKLYALSQNVQHKFLSKYNLNTNDQRLYRNMFLNIDQNIVQRNQS